MHGYGHIAALFTILFKNDFYWIDEATQTFQILKEAMTSTPVLVLSKFDLQSEVETDASSIGIGVVLMQTDHPITFFY